MIDWIGVVTNSLWVLGLAVVLAVLSIAYSSSQAGPGAKRRLRDILGERPFQIGLWTGLLLFCAGIALSGGHWWERVLWGALAVMAAVEIWMAYAGSRVKPSGGERSD